MDKDRPCEFFDRETLLYYIGYDKDGLGDNAKKEYKRRYGVKYTKELVDAGWSPGCQDEISGWFDPINGVHYLPEQAIAINTLRNRKRTR